MIKLEQGNNTIFLTLSEKVTLTNPKFLFRFVKCGELVEFSCLSSYLSEHKERFNTFTIKVKTSPNALLGEINLTSAGQYDYYVYEQTSSTNLDWELATNLVESGIMIYKIDASERKEYTRTTNTRKSR